MVGYQETLPVRLLWAAAMAVWRVESAPEPSPARLQGALGTNMASLGKIDAPRSSMQTGSHIYARSDNEAWARVVKRPADLPDYDDPPVNEVVIGIQFDRTAMTGAHVGLFWEGLRDEFPKASEQPPLEPKIEPLQPRRFSAPIFEFVSWRGSRYWLISEDDVQLIQVQADRLLYNWRRGPNNAAYPHFETLQERFWSIAKKWSNFLEQREQVLKLTQWEVTYINHIPTPNGQPSLTGALSFWGEELDHALGGTAEASRMEAQRILTEDGSPWARMYISVVTGIRPDEVPLIAFELTVRGPAEGEKVWEATQDRVFRARRQIVTAFDTLTTPAMHALWGKRT